MLSLFFAFSSLKPSIFCSSIACLPSNSVIILSLLSILFCIFSILFLTSSCSLFALLLIVSLFSVWIPLILFSRFSWSFLSFPSVSFLELSKTSSSFAWTASILSFCLVSILSILLCISSCNLFIFFICKSWLLYFLFNYLSSSVKSFVLTFFDSCIWFCFCSLCFFISEFLVTSTSIFPSTK